MRLSESDKYFSLAGRQACELNFEEALLEAKRMAISKLREELARKKQKTS